MNDKTFSVYGKTIVQECISTKLTKDKKYEKKIQKKGSKERKHSIEHGGQVEYKEYDGIFKSKYVINYIKWKLIKSAS